MHDRFVYDVGDFGKFGLLRCLASIRGRHALRVGINWYRNTGETSGGNFVDYLSPFGEPVFKSCDPDLYETLRVAHDSGVRSVSALQSRMTPLLGVNPIFWDAPVDPDDRVNWHRLARETLKGADLILSDPDTGISVVPTVRHATTQELRSYLSEGKALVIYDHHNRWSGASVNEQGKIWLAEFRSWCGEDGRPLADLAWAWSFRRGSSRLFYLIRPSGRFPALADAAKHFGETDWTKSWAAQGLDPHFAVVDSWSR